MEEKALTVLMPVKNGGRFLPDAIRGIEAMVNQLDEVLVIDDGSTDETLRTLKLWAESNPQVRVISNRGFGLVDALNLGLAEAKFDWIARVDVDDRYSKDRLSMQKSLIQNDTVAIFCDYDIFYDGVKPLGTIHSGVLSPAVSISLLTSQRTAHPASLFNKEAALSVGGYRKQDFPAEDLSLWLRLSRLGKLKSIPQTLLHYRMSQGSISSTKPIEMARKRDTLLKDVGLNPMDVQKFLEDYFNIFKEYEYLEGAAQRRVLLFRDYQRLHNYSDFAKAGMLVNKHFTYWLLKSPTASLHIAHMAHEKMRRKFHRSANFPKHLGSAANRGGINL
jgi:glycosyltransferase involved in cell wall biosynthesis